MASSGDYGSFIATTSLFDVSQIYSTDVNSEQFKELIVKLYQNQNSVNLLLNQKDTGIYHINEFVCGQQYIIGTGAKQIFRKVIVFGALPNAAGKSVAHGIGTPGAGGTIKDYTFTRIYGAASDPTNRLFIPLPYASPTDVDNIELSLDDTNVIITTGIDRTAFTKAYCVIEYWKF